MSKSQISDRDIERFFSRQKPEDEVLAELMPRLHEWHARQVRNPSNDQVKVFAVEASQIALASRPEQPTTAAATRTRSGRRLLRRLSYQLGVGLAALVLVSGMTGVAVASNEAAPGDALYGVDRALEAVGINNGGAAERIAEAQVLLSRGQPADAVEHAIEALEVTEGDSENLQSAQVLRDVAEKLRAKDNGSENSQDVHERVAAMLELIADAKGSDGPNGNAFGHEVSKIARGIIDPTIGTPANSGNAGDSSEKSGNAKPEKAEKTNNGNSNGNGNGNGNSNGKGKPADKPGNNRP